MSLSRNPSTIKDLTDAASKRSKMPDLPPKEKQKAAPKRKEVPTDSPAKTKKAKEKVSSNTKAGKQKDSTKSDEDLTVRPRTQVRVTAYSMEKIKAIMNIKGIQYSHEAINHILDIAEEHIFTELEKTLYEAQMEFQRIRFEENGWDTEK